MQVDVANGNPPPCNLLPTKFETVAQELLRTMLNADIYNLWFAPIQAVDLESETLCALQSPMISVSFGLKDNYLGLIQDVLAHARVNP